MKNKIMIIIIIATISSFILKSQNTIKPSSPNPVQKETIKEKGLVAEFYYQKSGQPKLPVIFLSGSEGGLSVDVEAIKPFVEADYDVIAVAYFKEDGLPQELISVPLEFFDQLCEWLNKCSDVVKGKTAIVGGSKGGELALLLASMHPEVKAVVGVVPSAYVFQGIAPRLHMNSSWSYRGKDIPFVPYKFDKDFFDALQKNDYLRIYQKALEDKEAALTGRIEVEKINGPVLLLSGRKDEIWPSTKMCDYMIDTLRSKNFKYHYEHIAFDSGHGIEFDEEREKILKFLKEYYRLDLI